MIAAKMVFVNFFGRDKAQVHLYTLYSQLPQDPVAIYMYVPASIVITKVQSARVDCTVQIFMLHPV